MGQFCLSSIIVDIMKVATEIEIEGYIFSALAVYGELAIVVDVSSPVVGPIVKNWKERRPSRFANATGSMPRLLHVPSYHVSGFAKPKSRLCHVSGRVQVGFIR